jgi:two-component system cell cycle sensor histidine kinase/response regulator CckA
VFTAKDGKEVCKVYKEYKEQIDIVLTDMGLPGTTGMDVFKSIKEIAPNVRVIFASGFFEPEVKSELLKDGAMGFIQKPCSMDEILRILREVLDKKALNR